MVLRACIMRRVFEKENLKTQIPIKKKRKERKNKMFVQRSKKKRKQVDIKNIRKSLGKFKLVSYRVEYGNKQ